MQAQWPLLYIGRFPFDPDGRFPPHNSSNRPHRDGDHDDVPRNRMHNDHHVDVHRNYIRHDDNGAHHGLHPHDGVYDAVRGDNDAHAYVHAHDAHDVHDDICRKSRLFLQAYDPCVLFSFPPPITLHSCAAVPYPKSSEHAHPQWNRPAFFRYAKP